MPSGYTSKLYEGKTITKEEFIWDCARAFGALIDMRDEPTDAKVPEEFEPKHYYLEEKELLEERLEALLSLTSNEIEKRIEEEYKQRSSLIQNTLKEKRELKQRYEAMIEEVGNWEPPTEEHVNLKLFCLNQLKESMKVDCGSIQRYEEMQVEKLTPEKWLSEKKEDLVNDINYYRKQWEEEQERVGKRNQWVRELRNSLNAK